MSHTFGIGVNEVKERMTIAILFMHEILHFSLYSIQFHFLLQNGALIPSAEFPHHTGLVIGSSISFDFNPVFEFLGE